jgi:hypothetical protein
MSRIDCAKRKACKRFQRLTRSKGEERKGALEPLSSHDIKKRLTLDCFSRDVLKKWLDRARPHSTDEGFLQ